MNLAELRKKAKGIGCKGYSRATKNEIVSLIAAKEAEEKARYEKWAIGIPAHLRPLVPDYYHYVNDLAAVPMDYFSDEEYAVLGHLTPRGGSLMYHVGLDQVTCYRGARGNPVEPRSLDELAELTRDYHPIELLSQANKLAKIVMHRRSEKLKIFYKMKDTMLRLHSHLLVVGRVARHEQRQCGPYDEYGEGYSYSSTLYEWVMRVGDTDYSFHSYSKPTINGEELDQRGVVFGRRIPAESLHRWRFSFEELYNYLRNWLPDALHARAIQESTDFERVFTWLRQQDFRDLVKSLPADELEAIARRYLGTARDLFVTAQVAQECNHFRGW